MTDSKRKILSSAEKLFASKGYDGVSVLEIAMKAGISKSLIFHHFKNKQNIFLAVLKTRLETIEAQLREVVEDESKDAVRKFSDFIDTYVDLLVKHSPLFKIVFRETFNADMSISRAIVEHNAKLASLIRQVISEGIKNQEMSEEVNPEKCSILLLISLNSLAATETLQKGKGGFFSVNVFDLKEEIKKLFLAGVKRDG